jgi:YbdK family carboxylate-amine ligase
MPAPSDEITIGVEEEYQILNPATRELRPRAARILPDARTAVGDQVTNELYLSQIEIGTPVCTTLADVRAELTRLRRELIAAAARNGSRIAAAGTHPFSRWEDQPLTPKPRYRGLEADYQQLIREQVIFGCHVHVGIADPEAAVQVMNRARPWVAPLIALAANSPFWLGVDTGYASYRTELFGCFPTAGTPHPFASRAEFDALVVALAATGVIEDGSKIYWDIRPSSHLPTLEFRAPTSARRWTRRSWSPSCAGPWPGRASTPTGGMPPSNTPGPSCCRRRSGRPPGMGWRATSWTSLRARPDPRSRWSMGCSRSSARRWRASASGTRCPGWCAGR